MFVQQRGVDQCCIDLQMIHALFCSMTFTIVVPDGCVQTHGVSHSHADRCVCEARSCDGRYGRIQYTGGERSHCNWQSDGHGFHNATPSIVVHSDIWIASANFDQSRRSFVDMCFER
ncbi:hypothetical protein PHSY_006988 [Pseudozyma hubeiensis SY62]|uniref:Uncharacterized protein n=1 Tax=Pseudozyma hubeiensis (strain SY62) TaxID=1305764 RepID=R9PDT2_PSEHS|nr:hypothetical protein PHSY_006988 [Pseudozyma hubeiensis SY62]GAC99387.1 hypothetical protein PHSY_006988 [Pseudozyma hubeiensis SY62]